VRNTTRQRLARRKIGRAAADIAADVISLAGWTIG
jgi:hypothetical protein